MKIRTRRPYQAQLWTQDRDDYRAYSLAATKNFRSPGAARRQCERWMASRAVQETRYRSANVRPWADVVDIRTNTELASVRAPVEIVPSVGELGYW